MTIEKMTDEQLVKAVIIEVMGCTRKDVPQEKWSVTSWRWYWEDAEGNRLAPDWFPLDKDGANDRDMVVEKMAGMGYSLKKTRHPDDWEMKYPHYATFTIPFSNFHDDHKSDVSGSGGADTPGRAVCIAALKAVRSES